MITGVKKAPAIHGRAPVRLLLFGLAHPAADFAATGIL